MHKPKNWEDHQDDIPYTEVVSFAVSLSTASSDVGIEHLSLASMPIVVFDLGLLIIIHDVLCKIEKQMTITKYTSVCRSNPRAN